MDTAACKGNQMAKEHPQWQDIRPEEVLIFVELDGFTEDCDWLLEVEWLFIGEDDAMRNAKAGNRSVGSRIIERLEGFKKALKSRQRISERFTCRKVVLDLEPPAYGPEQVKQTRKLLNASQTLFAKFLGVSPSTVRAWEHGANVPSPMACRFLEEIRRDPQHWIERLKSAVVYK